MSGDNGLKQEDFIQQGGERSGEVRVNPPIFPGKDWFRGFIINE